MAAKLTAKGPGRNGADVSAREVDVVPRNIYYILYICGLVTSVTVPMAIGFQNRCRLFDA